MRCQLVDFKKCHLSSISEPKPCMFSALSSYSLLFCSILLVVVLLLPVVLVLSLIRLLLATLLATTEFRKRLFAFGKEHFCLHRREEEREHAWEGEVWATMLCPLQNYIKPQIWLWHEHKIILFQICLRCSHLPVILASFSYHPSTVSCTWTLLKRYLDSRFGVLESN